MIVGLHRSRFKTITNGKAFMVLILQVLRAAHLHPTVNTNVRLRSIALASSF